MLSKVPRLIFLLSILFTCSCGSSSKADGYEIEGIRLNTEKLEMQTGDKERVQARVYPSVANTPTLQWSSSDNNVATVTNGTVEAISEGTAEITVSCQKVSSKVMVSVSRPKIDNGCVLMNLKLNSLTDTREISLNDAGTLDDTGLTLTQTGKLAKINHFYALGERMIRYRVRPSDDAVVDFQSSEKDFLATLNVPEKTISINTTPIIKKSVPFLKGDSEYDVEIYHIYNVAKVKITDVATNSSEELSATNDGQGGCGKGALQQGYPVGMQWDYYCVGLEKGKRATIERATVFSLKDNVRLLIYGDSITQPEGYFPKDSFKDAWTQRIINHLDGNAMSSGRGGGTIDYVLEYIKNELPFIKCKYVMVTIGTNGGNTREKLVSLVEYIKSQGAIPILNNIPCNESGTQIACNELIESVRKDLNIQGCRFDIATSLSGDGKEVDKSLMFYEDYSGSYNWQIYHHPNGDGGLKMYQQTLADIPEIYE